MLSLKAKMQPFDVHVHPDLKAAISRELFQAWIQPSPFDVDPATMRKSNTKVKQYLLNRPPCPLCMAMLGWLTQGTGFTTSTFH
jgi:hypothetical protein